MDFFNGMTALEQAYWICAIIGSVLLFIVFLGTFIGGVGTDGDVATDDFQIEDGGMDFQFFTFKNFVAFLTMLGWSGIVCLDAGMTTIVSVVISFIAGVLMMFLTSMLFYFMNKLTQSGTMDIQKAIGQVGTVYLPIGAARSAKGKVQITVQGSLRELDAVSDDEAGITSNQMIKVVQVLGSELLLVEKFSKS